VITVTAAEWTAFLTGAAEGEFDRPGAAWHSPPGGGSARADRTWVVPVGGPFALRTYTQQAGVAYVCAEQRTPEEASPYTSVQPGHERAVRVGLADDPQDGLQRRPTRDMIAV
jgi:hypothetical protein